MRKVIRRHVRHRGAGLDVAIDVNAVVAVNHAGPAGPGVAGVARDADQPAGSPGDAGPRARRDPGDESPKEGR